jgi:murein DD-endopeptidase MepM/ murein hydrolase activator NlpD
MRKLTQASLPLLLLYLVTGQMCGQETGRYTNVAHQFIEAIKAADYDRIQAMFGEGMRTAMPLEKSRTFFEGLTGQRGKPQSLGLPRPEPPGVVFPVRFEQGSLDMKLVLNQRDQIVGFRFVPPKAPDTLPKTNQTQLSLPLRGPWLVGWGGDTRELNQHHDSPSQRFAFDLVGVGNDGKTRRGKGNGNDDYYAFGREVLAPADGQVIKVIEGVDDNAPGSMNRSATVGNCVMIQHREDEVSVLAHFKQGSIVVKVGDQVKRGQVLGQCGNTGNSSEPHIHYHLQDSPMLSGGLGIKCVFAKVALTRDRKPEIRTNYSPVKGDIVIGD